MGMQGIQPEVLSLELISRYIPCEKLLLELDASTIGIVICDRRLRYKALNRSVAKIHNVPIEAHLGHKFHEILGGFAERVAPLWENVFASGQRLSNLDITGQLPKRSGVGRWIENLFPLTDSRGRVAQVGCFVIEIASPPIASSSSSSPIGEATSATGHQPSGPDRPQRTLLTRREQEIVRLVAEGKSNKEISSLLAISVRTVETYRSRLMLKLQASSTAHLVQYAIKNRIITL
ncbi:MAG: domain S-box [Candidatus Acidoferrum typicum]|nr:domain S-box [Candidatus Acidoferrum typicum]